MPAVSTVIAATLLLTTLVTAEKSAKTSNGDLVAECKKVIQMEQNDYYVDSLAVICRRFLALESARDAKKRGYDFIRFGRSSDGSKKESGTKKGGGVGYDFIRFGKRQL